MRRWAWVWARALGYGDDGDEGARDLTFTDVSRGMREPGAYELGLR